MQTVEIYVFNLMYFYQIDFLLAYFFNMDKVAVNGQSALILYSKGPGSYGG